MTYLGEKLLANFRTPREQNEPHLRFIRDLPSCISGATDCIAHHLLSAGGRGIGRKADDKWTVPLTSEEHALLHHECTSRTEEQWFWDHGVLVHILARTLWALSGDNEAAEHVILTHRNRR